MENTQDLLTDSLVAEEVAVETEQTSEIDASLAESIEEMVHHPEQPTEEMSELDKLIARRTGFYPIRLDAGDLKWLKNACNSNKFTFVGPNEAFMLMNCFMGFSAAIANLEKAQAEKSETDGTVQVQASAVEAAAILLNKYESSGLESAQRVFRIAIALNSAVMEMKQLDQIINSLKIEQAKNDELKAQEAKANGSTI